MIVIPISTDHLLQLPTNLIYIFTIITQIVLFQEYRMFDKSKDLNKIVTDYNYSICKHYLRTKQNIGFHMCNTLHKIDRVVLYSIDYCLLFSEQYFSFTDQDENKFINYKSYIEMKYICGWANWDKAFDSHWKKYEVYEKFSPVLVTTAMHLLFIQIYKRCLVFETVYRMFIFD
jgi:hypothetical protein